MILNKIMYLKVSSIYSETLSAFLLIKESCQRLLSIRGYEDFHLSLKNPLLFNAFNFKWFQQCISIKYKKSALSSLFI